MSVRSRIKDFEALSQKDDNCKEQKNEESTTERKKTFRFPGSNRKTAQTEQDQVVPGIAQSRSKPSVLSGFEADLQEVWSVRKNIHHSIDKPSTIAASTVNTSMASTLTAGKYSRHGAFPARQSQGPKDVFNKGVASNLDKHALSLENKPSPLKEHNSHEARSWNVKMAGFSYSEPAKRPMGSPHGDLRSPPTAKRKMNIANIMNESVMATKDTDQKVGYAKRMARAHLKSVGIGEFTPKLDSYCRNSGEREADDELQDLGGGKPRWKKVASDEFDF